MIQEKINIKYLPKKKLFTVFTQDVLTSVKQQYKFHSVYCLSIKNHHQIFTNYIFSNKWINVNSPSQKTFCTGDRYPEHWSAVSVVTCANVRPMWTMWPSSAAWDHCQCAGHISAGEEWYQVHFNYMQSYVENVFGCESSPNKFYTFVGLLVS